MGPPGNCQGISSVKKGMETAMKRITRNKISQLATIGTLAGGLLLASRCSNGVEGAVSGAAMGSLLGMGLGSLSGDMGKGAAAGALIGGGIGAVVGDQNSRRSPDW